MKDLKRITELEAFTLDQRLLEVVAYRKSGLSLNHVIGCSLDCAYCVRHFFGNFEMKEPHMLCSDDEAVNRLVTHKFFIPNVTPLQLFNRATDPFLPGVKAHTHEVLAQLDRRGLKNPVLVITRAAINEEDMVRLESLRHLELSLLVTYSGLNNANIEPISVTDTTTNSIRLASKYKARTKLILYWRPIVAGWNDDDDSFRRVFQVARLVDAVVYTGYYHRQENHAYLRTIGVGIGYGDYARRKFLPTDLEKRVLDAYSKSGLTVPLFRKTSCGVAYVHEKADYNGHWGVNELCDICPETQRNLCRNQYRAPSEESFISLLKLYDYDTPFLIEDGHIWTANLGEERRYHLQHTLQYQVWDIDQPHFVNRHGRAPFGHPASEDERIWYEDVKRRFYREIGSEDD